MRYLLLTFSSIFSICVGYSQLNATFTQTVNTNCNGSGCNYEGPSILINELMISPTVNDGSISGNGGVSTGRGEWIELYNPNLCEPIDISCFYLGNNTAEGAGGFVIPAGTVVPAAGFCMIRGANAAPVPANLLVANGGNVVEVVVPFDITDPGVCAGGTRLWFPNSGGWFAFYDQNGVPQDAVSWAAASNTTGLPCIAQLAGCTAVASLPSYSAIPADRKNFITTPGNTIPNSWGESLRRIPDGGAWNANGTPTYAVCNSTCATPNASSCTGTATVNVTGGTAPYSYQWDDTQAQLTQTATGLCAGDYTVTVTDNGGLTSQFTVTILDLVPTVSIDIPTQVCIDETAFAITNISPVASGSAVGTLTGTGVSGSNFNPQNAGAGTHVVTYDYTDENGCTNLATDNIVVNPLPVVNITNNASPYCISSTPANLTLSPTGGTLSGPGVTNNQFIPSAAGIGSHTLTYTYTDANGCSNSTTVNVTVVGIPAPAITVPEFLCIHDSPVTATATPAGGDFTINGAAGSSINPANLGAGVHSVSYTYTDPNGCQASSSETFTVLPRPTLNFTVASPFCFEPGIVPLGATPVGGTYSGTHVAGNNLNLTGVTPGSYTVTYEYTDTSGCENTATATYAVSGPIYPSFVYQGDCFQNATFAPAPLNAVNSYAWVVDGDTVSNAVTPSINFPQFGANAVTLEITDANGCSFDTTQVIQIAEGVKVEDFVVPNVLTVNDDNINDELTIPALLDECLTYKIIIVNRWGNTVYEMENMQNPFKGYDAKGNPLSEGIYFYRIESDDLDCTAPELSGKCHGFIHVVVKK